MLRIARSILVTLGLTLVAKVGAADTLFRETWESGSGNWQQTNAFCTVNGLGAPLIVNTEAASCSNKYLRESTTLACGRVFTKSLITVVPGKPYCLGALIRVNGPASGDRAYLGIHFAATPQIPQASGVGEHWLIGGNGTYLTGYAGADKTTPVPGDGAWHWVTKSFTPTAGETTFVLKGEEGQGSVVNTSDFDEITVVDGACPTAPLGYGGSVCTNGCDSATNLCAACTSDFGGAGAPCPRSDLPVCLTTGASAGSCAAAAVNGAAPTNGQVCTAGAATHCASSVCSADGACGRVAGETCASASQCRSGICGGDGKCGGVNGDSCSSDIECRSGTCNSVDGRCGVFNGEPCTSDAVCRGAKCGTDGKCGLRNGNVCTSSDACRSAVCLTGACVPFCSNDGECATDFFCDTTSSTCFPKAANGSRIGTVLESDCDRDSECLSGACGSDGACGSRAGQTCTAMGKCRSPNGCFNGNCESSCLSNDAAGDARCSPGGWCDGSKCQNDYENGFKPGGDPCLRGAQCKSGICGIDGMCGALTGDVCKLAAECRTLVCGGGYCKAACATDAECPANRYCDAGTHSCLLDLANATLSGGAACTSAAQCVSGICESGTCGAPNGGACGPGPILCRSLICDANDNGCGYKNGAGPCTTGSACRTGVCDADNLCGFANESACKSSEECRSNRCDVKSLACVACERDGDCEYGNYCDGVGTKKAVCKSLKATGSQCLEARECAVNICSANACGAASGAACASDDECQNGKCASGVCEEKTQTAVDAGKDSGTKVAADSGVETGDQLGGGGCACSETPGSGGSLALFGLTGIVTAFALRRRRAR